MLGILVSLDTDVNKTKMTCGRKATVQSWSRVKEKCKGEIISTVPPPHEPQNKPTLPKH